MSLETIKIRNLPDATSVSGSDQLVLQQMMETSKITVDALVNEMDLLKQSEIEDAGGASIVGTHSGSSVQQELDSVNTGLLVARQNERELWFHVLQGVSATLGEGGSLKLSPQVPTRRLLEAYPSLRGGM